jgi:hypothetical protein
MQRLIKMTKLSTEKLLSTVRTERGRLWIKKVILFIIILLGLRWAIYSGIRKSGVLGALDDIERELEMISNGLDNIHLTLIK